MVVSNGQEMSQAAPSFASKLQEYGEIRAEAERLRQETTRRLVDLEARAARLEAELAAAAGGASQLKTELAEGTGGSAPQLSKVAHTVNVVSAAMPKTRKRAYADRSDHPFPRRVGNVAKWANSQDPRVPVSTARSWYSNDPKVARPIPEHYYLQLKRDFGIPKSAWKNGVTTRTRKRPAPAGSTAAPV